LIVDFIEPGLGALQLAFEQLKLNWSPRPLRGRTRALFPASAPHRHRYLATRRSHADMVRSDAPISRIPHSPHPALVREGW
jgi:hypothetical protein